MRYGFSPQNITKKTNSLPTELIFYCHNLNAHYPISKSGVSQFLNRINQPNTEKNIDWMLNKLLNLPTDEQLSIINKYSISISYEYDGYPSRNATLSDLGITKSMVERNVQINDLPDMDIRQRPYQTVQKSVYETPYGNIPTGEGVLLDKDFSVQYNSLLKKTIDKINKTGKYA